jgi:hypothetical protein
LFKVVGVEFEGIIGKPSVHFSVEEANHIASANAISLLEIKKKGGRRETLVLGEKAESIVRW